MTPTDHIFQEIEGKTWHISGTPSIEDFKELRDIYDPPIPKTIVPIILPIFKRNYLKRLSPKSYEKLTIKKKINFWCDSWCTDHYGAQISGILRNPNHFVTYQVPWYGKIIYFIESKTRS